MYSTINESSQFLNFYETILTNFFLFTIFHAAGSGIAEERLSKDKKQEILENFS